MTTTFHRTARRTSTWSAPGKWSRAAAAEAAAIAATAPTTSPAPATFNNAVATAGGDTSLGGKRQLQLRTNCRDLTLQQRDTSTQLVDSRFLLRDTALK